jgi:hypothetical protein
MPGNDCFWLDDGQCRAPVEPEAGQVDPQQSVPRSQFRAFSCGPLKHAETPDIPVSQPVANLRSFLWQPHCRNLYQTPVAA